MSPPPAPVPPPCNPSRRSCSGSDRAGKKYGKNEEKKKDGPENSEKIRGKHGNRVLGNGQAVAWLKMLPSYRTHLCRKKKTHTYTHSPLTHARKHRSICSRKNMEEKKVHKTQSSISDMKHTKHTEHTKMNTQERSQHENTHTKKKGNQDPCCATAAPDPVGHQIASFRSMKLRSPIVPRSKKTITTYQK